MALVVLGILFLLLGGAGLAFGLSYDFSSVPEGSFLAKLGDFPATTLLVLGVVFAIVGLLMLIIGLVGKKKLTTLQLVESAVAIAIAVVLNEFLKIPSPLGGGLTVVSMLPLVMISHRYGAGWGLFTAFVFSLIELVFGLKNIGYAESTVMAVGIIFLDYILAYSVIGLSGVFGKSRAAVAVGIIVTFTLRFLCHLISGAWIWGVWMPDEYMGMTMTNPWIYSALYNGWYMAAELVLTLVVAMLIYKPLEKYFRGEKLVK
jgi:thiamine transporter